MSSGVMMTLIICGTNTNCNVYLGTDNVKYLIDILNIQWKTNKNNEIMELIASLAFVILGDFDCVLDSPAKYDVDIIKTEENLNKLNKYFSKTF